MTIFNCKPGVRYMLTSNKYEKRMHSFHISIYEPGCGDIYTIEKRENNDTDELYFYFSEGGYIKSNATFLCVHQDDPQWSITEAQSNEYKLKEKEERKNMNTKNFRNINVGQVNPDPDSDKLEYNNRDIDECGDSDTDEDHLTTDSYINIVIEDDSYDTNSTDVEYTSLQYRNKLRRLY